MQLLCENCGYNFFADIKSKKQLKLMRCSKCKSALLRKVSAGFEEEEEHYELAELSKHKQLDLKSEFVNVNTSSSKAAKKSREDFSIYV